MVFVDYLPLMSDAVIPPGIVSSIRYRIDSLTLLLAYVTKHMGIIRLTVDPTLAAKMGRSAWFCF